MTADRNRGSIPPWFASWFDSSHYHRLYSHRDEREAARFIEALVRELRPRPGSAMLDLGCGAGRHARCLASKGFSVTGLDLSRHSIREASRAEGPLLRFVQGDMREPFGDAQFDYVLNLFTSFGYFDGLGEHLGVVRNIADSLKTGGRLVLDYLNVRRGAGRAVGEEKKTIDGVVYHVTRWTDADRLYKRIVVEDGRRGPAVEHVERVAKLTLKDFGLMLGLHALRIERVFGDYDLGPYEADSSPRLVIVARKRPRASEDAMRHAS